MSLITSIYEWILQGVISFISLLPESPIQTLEADSQVQQIFGYINWVVPLARICGIMGAILGATIIWYAIRWILRFAQYIE